MFFLILSVRKPKLLRPFWKSTRSAQIFLISVLPTANNLLLHRGNIWNGPSRIQRLIVGVTGATLRLHRLRQKRRYAWVFVFIQTAVVLKKRCSHWRHILN